MKKISLAALVLASLAAAGIGYSSPKTPTAPDVADIQRAYDNEAAIAAEKHEKDLRIVGVDCKKEGGGSRISCQVGFVKPVDFGDRVFLDAALLERKGDDWKLLRGLCRRLL